jgi:ADP-ribosyl-[dinitrogen reductase] hydrolase
MSLYRNRYPSWFEARDLAMSGTLKINWHDRMGITPPPLSSDVDVADKVDGMILGLAIGDSLGNTSEARNPSERRQAFGWIDGYLPNRRAGGLRVGLPSDDTQLAAWTIEQYLALGRLEPQLLGNRFCAERIFGLGGSVRDFIRRFKAGATWETSGSPSAGNGALMRIAPVLIPYVKNASSELWADVLLAAHLTHDDHLSNASCLALAHTLWALLGLRGVPESTWWINEWISVFDDVAPNLEYSVRNDHPPGFCGSLQRLLREYVVPALEQDLPVDEACTVWHSGAYLLETIPSALYILARHGHDPQQAILEAVNNTRDNDTIAAIVGAAVGALHGARALPEAWLDGLLGRSRSDDDHHLFLLLTQCAEKVGYTAREQTLERAMSARRELEPQGSWLPKLDAKLKLPMRGWWIKVVGFMVHTWAVPVIDPITQQTRVWFFDDRGVVFDCMTFNQARLSKSGLERNGFKQFDRDADRWVESPMAWMESIEFTWQPSWIYSSGQYWVNS